MFNKIQKVIKEKGRSVHLSSEERNLMRDNIASYMEYHPVRDGVLPRLHNQRSYLQVLNLNRIMPIALIAALMFTGGISFAAEQTVPGDMLYPLKVRVNEEVRGLVSLSPEARAEWESRITERRLEEAEKLALKGEARADLVAGLEEKFELHTERVQSRISEFESEGKVDIAERLSANLENSLRNHQRVLGFLSSSTATTTAPLHSLKIKVEMRVEKFEEAKERIRDHFSEKTEEQAKIAAENKLNASINKIEAAKNFLEAQSGKIDSEAYADLQAKVALAEAKNVEAKASLENGDYLESFLLSQEAHRLAQDVHMLPGLHMRLDQGINLKTMIGGGHGPFRGGDDDSDDNEVEEDDDSEEEDSDDDSDSEVELDSELNLNLNL